MRSERTIVDKVLGKFNSMKDHYVNVSGYSPEKAAAKALDQTLYPGGFKDAGVNLGDLDSQTSQEVARALIEGGGGPRLAEIAGEFTKGKHGDIVDQINFGDPRAKRVLASTRRITHKR